MPSINPSQEQLQAFLSQPDDGPAVMINLLRYRERAQYEPGSQATPCSGREAYERYSAVAVGKVQGVGGRILWLGRVAGIVIGPEEEHWDDAVLVEYPSRQAFLQMVSQPDYQEAAKHRTAALADSRLIATKTVAGSF